MNRDFEGRNIAFAHKFNKTLSGVVVLVCFCLLVRKFCHFPLVQFRAPLSLSSASAFALLCVRILSKFKHFLNSSDTTWVFVLDVAAKSGLDSPSIAEGSIEPAAKRRPRDQKARELCRKFQRRRPFSTTGCLAMRLLFLQTALSAAAPSRGRRVPLPPNNAARVSTVCGDTPLAHVSATGPGIVSPAFPLFVQQARRLNGGSENGVLFSVDRRGVDCGVPAFPPVEEAVTSRGKEFVSRPQPTGAVTHSLPVSYETLAAVPWWVSLRGFSQPFLCLQLFFPDCLSVDERRL